MLELNESLIITDASDVSNRASSARTMGRKGASMREVQGPCSISHLSNSYSRSERRVLSEMFCTRSTYSDCVSMSRPI